MSIKPFFWSVANGVGTRALSFVFFVLISRLITPSDFGVMALALIVALVIDTLVEQGLSSAVVQRQDLSNEHISSVFVYQTCLALMLGLVLWAFAPIITKLLSEPRLIEVLPWIGLSCFFNSLGFVKQGLLQRNLQFKILAIRNVAATMIGGLLGLWYARQGAGLNGLLIMHVSNAALGAAVLWTASGERIKIKLRKAKLIELLMFSRSVLGTRIIEVLSSRLDQLLIGQYFGTTTLGYYALAMRLYEVLIQTTSTPVADVAYPLFSRSQFDKGKLSGAYLRLIEYVGGLTVPLFIGAAAMAPFFVPVFFGQQWQPAVLYVVIILTIGSFNSLSSYNDVMFSAVGRPDIRLKLALAGLILWLISAIILLPLGGVYAAVAWSIRSMIMFPIKLWSAFRIMKAPIKVYVKKVFTLYASSGVMVCIIFFIKDLHSSYGLIPMMIAQIILGIPVYFLCLHVFGSSLPRHFSNFRQSING